MRSSGSHLQEKEHNNEIEHTVFIQFSIQKVRSGCGSRGAPDPPFSPREKEGGLCTGFANRAKCRKRAEATWEPAGRWLWRQLVVRAQLPRGQWPRYEPRASVLSTVSCLPALSGLVPRGTGDSGPEEAPLPGWQSHLRVFSQGPWVLPAKASALSWGGGSCLSPVSISS